MIHPLLDNIGNLTEQEILDKINTLSRNLYNTKNQYLLDQMYMILDDLKEALTSIQQKSKQENNDIDNLVKIN